MKKALVTGGAGFLGSHLCDRLVDEGLSVVCVDNLYTGSAKNIEHLMNRPEFQFIEHDIRETLEVDADYIYNLACPASPQHYQADPIMTIETNVLGALNMLELAKSNGARILQASTSEVYGEPLVHPQTEKYRGNVNPTGIRACYDEGKRMAETLFFDYHRQYGTDIRVVRIFNTYGPRMQSDDGRVVSNIIVQALKGEDITIYGDGLQTRSFCYVDDLIDGICRMMNAEGFTGPVNLGNPEEIAVLELTKKIIELTGTSSKIVHQSLPADDPTKRRPAIGLAERELGWKPSINLDEGLRKTIDYFKGEMR